VRRRRSGVPTASAGTRRRGLPASTTGKQLEAEASTLAGWMRRVCAQWSQGKILAILVALIAYRFLIGGGTNSIKCAPRLCILHASAQPDSVLALIVRPVHAQFAHKFWHRIRVGCSPRTRGWRARGYDCVVHVPVRHATSRISFGACCLIIVEAMSLLQLAVPGRESCPTCATSVAAAPIHCPRSGTVTQPHLDHTTGMPRPWAMPGCTPVDDLKGCNVMQGTPAHIAVCSSSRHRCQPVSYSKHHRSEPATCALAVPAFPFTPTCHSRALRT
jgi:hypothetical protein